MAKRLEDLHNWQLAREINKEIHILISRTSFNKDYPLKDQLNRSAASIMDNIAEGFERNGNKEFIQFLSFSKGSCGEFKSQLYRSKDRNHIDETEFNLLYDKTDHIGRMNSKLMAYLKNSELKGWKFNELVKLSLV